MYTTPHLAGKVESAEAQLAMHVAFVSEYLLINVKADLCRLTKSHSLRSTKLGLYTRGRGFPIIEFSDTVG